MNREEFIKEIANLGINLTEEQIRQFDLYCEFLLKYNLHTNLTAIKTTEEVYLKHFYDSATIAKVIDLTSIDSVLDIGTGAGFPGVVLKILYSHLNVVLLDSNNKKIKFLEELIKILNLNDITPINKRAEELNPEFRSSFDFVTARAVADLSILSELSIPLAKVGGYFLSLKGNKDEEITNATYAIELLGAQIEEICRLKLPKEESSRMIIKIKKVKETPDKYPRRYEKIKKNPLKKLGK